MIKFKVNDKVKITSGKDKGRDGNIEKVFPVSQKVIVPGVNMYKKHVKGMPGRKGGIYDVPRPIPFSKIAIICSLCGKVTRIGFKKVAQKTVRVCKKCKREIDINVSKKTK